MSNDPLATAALGDVLRERARHAEELGYDREHDDGLQVEFLPCQALRRMTVAVDRINPNNARRDIDGARKALVQSAALILAAIDRLDRAKGTGDPSLFDETPASTPLHKLDWHG